jgi:nicotinamidase-related amidase
MCVDATARAAADLGFKVMVASDACATRALTFGDITVPAENVHAAFLAALQSYGQVLTVEEIITHLAAEQVQNLKS